MTDGLRRISRNSLLYTGTSVLQKGVSFLLLPLYTRHLSPADYGIISVVSSLGAIISALTMMSLHAAISRFYFVYRDRPDVLREFWGTAITLVLCVSLAGGVLLLLTGAVVLAPFHAGIPFWPYVALGMASVALQPLSTIYMAILQVREQGGRYAFHSVVQFALTVMLVLGFVVLLGWDASGPLSASLLVTAAYFAYALYALRHDFRFCINRSFAREALRYSLPLVPHNVASQVTGASDRVLLNQLAGTAASGLYNIGAQFGGLMSFVADGVNRAFVPVAMSAMQDGSAEALNHLRRTALVLVAAMSLTASGVALFAPELLKVFTAERFHEAHVVVPFIAFGFVFGALYYVFVNIFFYQPRLTRFVAVCTVAGALLNIGLNYALIRAFGLHGAALAMLCTQAAVAAGVAILARPHELVRWDYRDLFAAPFVCLALTLVALGAVHGDSLASAVLQKAFAWSLLVPALGVLLWRDALYLPRLVARLRAGTPDLGHVHDDKRR